MVLELIDVVKIARQFADEAGWGYFKVFSINQAGQKWELIAELGAFRGKKMKFIIDDVKGKVVAYNDA